MGAFISSPAAMLVVVIPSDVISSPGGAEQATNVSRVYDAWHNSRRKSSLVAEFCGGINAAQGVLREQSWLKTKFL